MTQPHGTPESHDEKDRAPDGAAHDGGHDAHGGHGGDALGPIDWRMWGVGVLGVVAALVVVAGFVVATDFAFLTIGA